MVRALETLLEGCLEESLEYFLKLEDFLDQRPEVAREEWRI